MCIEQIRTEWELSQSTFGGGLYANYKWIRWTYMIILSQSISMWAHSLSCVRENQTESTTASAC